MGLWKRGQWYWLDVVVNGHRYREPLGTADWREARRLERERVEQLQSRASVPSGTSLAKAAMGVATAIAAYADERRAQVSCRMAAYWAENARPLGAYFGDTPLRRITSAQIAGYENARTDSGRAAKTVNGELSFYCGMRACEIKGLRWQDLDWTNRLLHIRRSKTPAGWRSPTLNPTCLQVLQHLHDQAAPLGFSQPDHFIFP